MAEQRKGSRRIMLLLGGKDGREGCAKHNILPDILVPVKLINIHTHQGKSIA